MGVAVPPSRINVCFHSSARNDQLDALISNGIVLPALRVVDGLGDASS